MRVFKPEKIRDRRTTLKLTQAELAKKVGTAREYIVELERGKSIPKVSMLAKLATALRVRESYFFMDNGSHS